MTAFAAMPVMFFVVGTMLPDVRTWPAYLRAVRRRGQRVLMPFWAYGAAVWGIAAALSPTSGQRLTIPSLHTGMLNWIVPLGDPTGATFHGGWLSSHLWYLRAYVWVILAMPLLAAAARRIRLGLTLCIASVIALEIAGRRSWGVLGSGTARLLIGDFVTYGLFVILGIWFAACRRAGTPGLSRRACTLVAAGAALGAVAFWRIAGLPGGEVNNSYPALVLTGVAWLGATQAAEGPLRRFADRPEVAQRAEALSGRALTVYLWHPAAIVVAHKLVQGSGPGWVATTLAAVAAGTLACVAAFGWLEDRARPGAAPESHTPRSTPPHPPRLVLGVAGLVVVALSVTQLRHDTSAAAEGKVVSGATGVAPSYRDALRNDAFPKLANPPTDDSVAPQGATTDVATATTVTTANDRTATSTPTTSVQAEAHPDAIPGAVNTDHVPATVKPTSSGGTGRVPVWSSDAFQAVLDQWLTDNPTATTVTASVVVDGEIWTGEAHRGTADSFHATHRYPILSITKTFTAALVLQAVDKGIVHLDETMPALPGIHAAVKAITVRQLLTHTSGLIDYTEADAYRSDRSITPVAAVNLSTGTPLRNAPGTEVHYANTNFLYLELLLEQRTGRTFPALMAELVGSVGLPQTTLEAADHPGWAASGSGGIVSTVTDLTEWADALLTPGRVLSAESVTNMITLDSHNIGLGTWPICPCWTDAHDAKHYTAIGHHFGSGGVEFYPATGLSVAARIDPTSDAAGGQAAEIGLRFSSLVARLRTAAGRTTWEHAAVPS